MRNKDWFEFQEEIAEYFRALGASATTNATVQGVRTSHDIDILVVTKFLGVNLKWVVEAKLWKSKVPKEKVLALRSIVSEIGADRGFLISEKGFQRGAMEAAANTNIQLATFNELKDITKKALQTKMLQEYEFRTDLLARRYWSHKKSIRVKYGLRDHTFDYSLRFSGQLFFGLIFAAIERAKKNRYPLSVRSMLGLRTGEDVVESYVELSNWLNQNLNMFDAMLLKAEHSMIINGDFTPSVEDINDLEAVESNKKHEAIMREAYRVIGDSMLGKDQ